MAATGEALVLLKETGTQTQKREENMSNKELIRRWFKMAALEDPEVTSSYEHKKLTATYGTIPSEKDLKIS